MSARVQEQVLMLDLEGLLLCDRFKVQYRLRCGSFSELWLAKDRGRKVGEPSEVIIKALNVRLNGAADPDFERMLEEGAAREARALQQCRHQNIVRLFDSGSATDNRGGRFCFLVLDYLQGKSLKEVLQRPGLAVADALKLLHQISDALSCVHRNGFVHRDVKPANIMVSPDHKQAVLIDLGSGRWLSDRSQLTEIGTTMYAAPEQFRAGQTAGELTLSVDVYGLAKTAYAMLSGLEPGTFRLCQITSLPRVVENEVWAGPVLRVLMKATDDDQAKRHQTVADFYADLCDGFEVTTCKTKQTRPSVERSRVVVEVAPLPRRPSWFFETSRLRGVVARMFGHIPVKLVSVIVLISVVCVGMLVLGAKALQFGRWLFSRPVSAKVVREEHFRATTDINIRETPDRRARKIGLVEKDSTVRVYGPSQSATWCEIEIVTHGRAKEDVSMADRGWVVCQYLVRE